MEVLAPLRANSAPHSLMRFALARIRVAAHLKTLTNANPRGRRCKFEA